MYVRDEHTSSAERLATSLLKDATSTRSVSRSQLRLTSIGHGHAWEHALRVCKSWSSGFSDKSNASRLNSLRTDGFNHLDGVARAIVPSFINSGRVQVMILTLPVFSGNFSPILNSTWKKILASVGSNLLLVLCTMSSICIPPQAQAPRRYPALERGGPGALYGRARTESHIIHCNDCDGQGGKISSWKV